MLHVCVCVCVHICVHKHKQKLDQYANDTCRWSPVDRLLGVMMLNRPFLSLEARTGEIISCLQGTHTCLRVGSSAPPGWEGQTSAPPGWEGQLGRRGPMAYQS